MTLSSRATNRLLWTAQIVLAMLFVFAGAMKFLMTPEQLQQGPVAFPVAFLQFIGAAEVLGGLGLVLPGLFRIRTELTGLAAAGLAIIMAGATVVSAATPGALFPFAVGAVAVSVAYGRWPFTPMSGRLEQVEAI